MSTVLVVDDSPIDQRLVGNLLQKQTNFAVEFASDGKQALAKLEAALPAAIITDLQMPEMNGLELVEAVREEYPLVPIILMTARGSEAIAGRALKCGAASYVPKRRLSEDLIETLQRVVSTVHDERAQSRLMHQLVHVDCEFALRSDLSQIQAMVSHLQQLLRCMPLGEQTERLRVGIAVEEALKNAYYHGNLEATAESRTADRPTYQKTAAERVHELPYRNRMIRVRAKISPEQAVFEICDEGPGFNTSRISESIDPQDPEHNSGRGLVLMKQIMDEVRFNEIGNTVTMTKNAPTDLDDESPEDD